eukprot:2337428-Rhodomonas_salina.3
MGCGASKTGNSVAPANGSRPNSSANGVWPDGSQPLPRKEEKQAWETPTEGLKINSELDDDGYEAEADHVRNKR